MKNKPFAEAIKSYLDRRASEDKMFAESYANPKKSISECCDFIVSEVKRQSRTAMTDDEVYGLAVHYYDEENIKTPANVPSCRIVVPGSTESAGEDLAGTENNPKADAGKKEGRKQPRPSREPEFVGTLFDFAGEDRL